MDQDNASSENGAGSTRDPGTTAGYVIAAVVGIGLIVSVIFFFLFTKKRGRNTALWNPGFPRNYSPESGLEPQAAGATRLGDPQDGHGSFNTPQETAKMHNSHGNTILDQRTTNPQLVPRQHPQPGLSPYPGHLPEYAIGDDGCQDASTGQSHDCKTSSEGIAQLGEVSRQPGSGAGAGQAPYAQLRADHGMQRNVSVLSRPLPDYPVSSAASVSPVSSLDARDRFNSR